VARSLSGARSLPIQSYEVPFGEVHDVPFIRMYEPVGDVLRSREYALCRSYCCHAVAKPDTDTRAMAAVSIYLSVD
jgi:hypothetical protein